MIIWCPSTAVAEEVICTSTQTIQPSQYQVSPYFHLNGRDEVKIKVHLDSPDTGEVAVVLGSKEMVDAWIQKKVGYVSGIIVIFPNAVDYVKVRSVNYSQESHGGVVPSDGDYALFFDNGYCDEHFDERDNHTSTVTASVIRTKVSWLSDAQIQNIIYAIIIIVIVIGVISIIGGFLKGVKGGKRLSPGEQAVIYKYHRRQPPYKNVRGPPPPKPPGS